MSSVFNHLSLTIGSHTPLKSAEDFLSKAAAGGKKIYGRKDETTREITLYAKSGTSLRHLVRDKVLAAVSRTTEPGGGAAHYATKKAVGREGVRQILERVLRPNDFSGSSTVAQRGTAALFASLEQGVTAGRGGLRAADLEAHLGGFDKLSRLQDIREIVVKQHAANAEPAGAKPSDMRGTSFAQKLDQACDHGPASVADLADAVAEGLKENHPSRGDQMLLMLRDLSGLKAGLKEELLARPHDGMSDEDLDRSASEAVEAARDRICGARAEPGPLKTILNEVVDFAGVKHPKNKFDLPSIAFKGKSYEPERYLATGGFGHIIRYKAPDGSKLIMKLPIIMDRQIQSESLNPTKEQINTARQAARNEIASHLAAEGAGHPNVLALRGGVELPNGSIGILFDFAEGGSATDLAYAMNDPALRAATGEPPQSGQITDADAETMSLTVAQDMLAGLGHMHDTQNVTSLDNKHANALLMREGSDKNGLPLLKAVLSDFGTLIEGTDKLSLKNTAEIGTPDYLAPEFDDAQSRRQAETKSYEGEVGEALQTHFAGRLNPNEQTWLVGDLDADYAKSRATGEIDSKVDIWGLGVSLAEMIGGKALDPMRLRPFARSGEDAVQPATIEMKDGVATPALANASLFSTLPASQKTLDLVNGLLKGNPTERFDAFSASRSPALQQRGVGSDESRALSGAVIAMRAALKTGDQGAIDAAKRDVDTARRALDQLRQLPSAPTGASPPVFRTSAGPMAPLDTGRTEPAKDSPKSLRAEVDAYINARLFERDQIPSTRRALDDGLDRKGPAPGIPGSGQ